MSQCTLDPPVRYVALVHELESLWAMAIYSQHSLGSYLTKLHTYLKNLTKELDGFAYRFKAWFYVGPKEWHDEDEFQGPIR